MVIVATRCATTLTSGVGYERPSQRPRSRGRIAVRPLVSEICQEEPIRWTFQTAGFRSESGHSTVVGWKAKVNPGRSFVLVWLSRVVTLNSVIHLNGLLGRSAPFAIVSLKSYPTVWNEKAIRELLLSKRLFAHRIWLAFLVACSR